MLEREPLRSTRSPAQAQRTRTRTSHRARAPAARADTRVAPQPGHAARCSLCLRRRRIPK
eukprot:7385588-Prymnesium_polylepis.3